MRRVDPSLREALRISRGEGRGLAVRRRALCAGPSEVVGGCLGRNEGKETVVPAVERGEVRVCRPVVALVERGAPRARRVEKAEDSQHLGTAGHNGRSPNRELPVALGGRYNEDLHHNEGARIRTATVVEKGSVQLVVHALSALGLDGDERQNLVVPGPLTARAPVDELGEWYSGAERVSEDGAEPPRVQYDVIAEADGG